MFYFNRSAIFSFMSYYSTLTVYCGLIIAASMFGGWLPSRLRLTHTRMQVVLSFVGGLMLGVGLLHMLPHGIAKAGSVDLVIGWTMFGLLLMFFLIRTFHFHQHDAPEADDPQVAGEPITDEHGDSHHHPSHRFSWTGVAIGLALHTLIDGIALGAAVVAEAAHAEAGGLFGLGVFLAILLHKPLDALSITSLMVAGGCSPRARQMVNVVFALMCPAGVVLLITGVNQIATNPDVYVGCALGFSAGVFLCISLADLLPEVQFHTHDRLKLSVALILGVVLAYGIHFVESPHMHGAGEEIGEHAER